jgi:hypothetical protein
MMIRRGRAADEEGAWMGAIQTPWLSDPAQPQGGSGPADPSR